MKITIESEALDSLKAMAQRLQSERDELLEALQEVSGQLRTIQLDHKERWSNERVNMTSGFLLMAERIIAKCTAKPEILE